MTISDEDMKVIKELREEILQYMRDSEMSLAEALGVLRVAQLDVREGKVPSGVKNKKKRKDIYKKLKKKGSSQAFNIGVLETLISDVFSLQKQKTQQQQKSDKGTISDPTV